MINVVEIIGSLAEYGILGVVIAILIYALNKKDKKVDLLQKRLLKKAETDGRKYYELSDALNHALEELFQLLKGNDNVKR